MTILLKHVKIGVVDVAVETSKFQIGECDDGCGGEAVVVSAKHLRHGNPNWLMAMLTDNLELCTGVWRLLIGLLEWNDVVGVLELQYATSSSGEVCVCSEIELAGGGDDDVVFCIFIISDDSSLLSSTWILEDFLILLDRLKLGVFGLITCSPLHNSVSLSPS
nr:hypothetical protein Iba_chr04fCG12720 [Ipomoea batatas]